MKINKTFLGRTKFKWWFLELRLQLLNWFLELTDSLGSKWKIFHEHIFVSCWFFGDRIHWRVVTMMKYKNILEEHRQYSMMSRWSTFQLNSSLERKNTYAGNATLRWTTCRWGFTACCSFGAMGFFGMSMFLTLWICGLDTFDAMTFRTCSGSCIGSGRFVSSSSFSIKTYRANDKRVTKC